MTRLFPYRPSSGSVTLVLAVLLLALTILLLAALTGCGPKTAKSTTALPTPDATVSAAMHTAEHRGELLLENCTPNGRAMIGGVITGHASALTYIQVGKYLLHGGVEQTWNCIAARPGPVPAPALKHALETCFDTRAQPLLQHPVRNLRRSRLHATVATALNDAAYCAGKNA